MPENARQTCLICNSQQLRPLLTLSEEGVPHGTAEHNFTYAYQIVTACGQCGHGQLEKYSHDCFHHYEDEDWEMYWWYVFDPATVLRLRTLLTGCPDRLNAKCSCALHHHLRISSDRLWGGVRHAVGPSGRIGFAWLSLEEQSDLVTLKVDRQKGPGQAA